MSQAGLSEEIIIGHVRANGFAGQLTSSDLIRLKQQGVSDGVISALQQMPAGRPVQTVVSPPPVIVEEHYYGRPIPPPCYPPGPWYYGRRPHTSWGFSIHR
jgi:hypothetical protein